MNFTLDCLDVGIPWVLLSQLLGHASEVHLVVLDLDQLLLKDVVSALILRRVSDLEGWDDRSARLL